MTPMEIARKFVAVLVAIVVCLSLGSCVVESVWTEPKIAVEGIPAEATLDQPITLKLTLEHHNRFDITEVTSTVEEPEVTNPLLLWPMNKREELDFLSYSHIVWPRSKTVTINTTLRRMLYLPTLARRDYPEVIRFTVNVDGWMVTSSQNPLALFTGIKPDSMEISSSQFEVRVKKR